MLPNCVILGAQKAGSTFLHRCLGEHPDVFTPTGEVHFFEDPNYSERELPRLEMLLEGGDGKRILAIKRPNYLARRECAPRIARHCSRAKLVAVLRNPVERAVSAYFHYVNYGFLPARNAERGLTAILEGKYDASHPAAGDILEYGLYAKHLARYLEYYGRDQLHISFHDDLSRDPLGAMRAVYRFLGIDDAYEPRALHARPQAVIYSLPRLRIRRLRNRFVYSYDEARSRSYQRTPTAFGRAINRAVTGFDNRVGKHLFPGRKPILSEPLKRRLLDLYREDTARLEKLTGRDLTAWTSPA